MARPVLDTATARRLFLHRHLLGTTPKGPGKGADLPNPTSGFLLFVPEEDVIELDMSVEDSAKLVISAGLVYPNPKDPSQPLTADSGRGARKSA